MRFIAFVLAVGLILTVLLSQGHAVLTAEPTCPPNYATTGWTIPVSC